VKVAIEHNKSKSPPRLVHSLRWS